MYDFVNTLHDFDKSICGFDDGIDYSRYIREFENVVQDV